MIKALVCRLVGHRLIFVEAENTTTTFKCVNCGQVFETEYRSEDLLE